MTNSPDVSTRSPGPAKALETAATGASSEFETRGVVSCRAVLSQGSKITRSGNRFPIGGLLTQSAHILKVD